MMLNRGTLGFVAAAALLGSITAPGGAAADSDRPRFAPQPPLAVLAGEAVGRQAMALADLNVDQRPDLVVIEPDQERVDVSPAMGAMSAAV